MTSKYNKSKEEIRQAQERLLRTKKKLNESEIEKSALVLGGKSLERLSQEAKKKRPPLKEQPEEPRAPEEIAPPSETLAEQKVPEIEAEEIPAPTKELKNLEEALIIARENIPPAVRQSEYTLQLSREPVQALYDQTRDLLNRAKEKEYLTSAEKRQLDYITGAIEEKIESGEYSFTEETAKKASLILKLASETRGLYKAEAHEKSWYKSG